MTEPPPTPRAIRSSIAEQLATVPGADHNGRSEIDRQADADRAARFAATIAPAAEPAPAQTGMKANRAQGSGGTVSAPAPTDPLAAIRAQVSKLVL